MADLQKKGQEVAMEFQKLQTDLQEIVSGRQKLEAQLQENKSVQKEFESLDDDSNIYKAVGPVLLKQDKSEASQAVTARLEFITNEIARAEKRIKEAEEKTEKKKMEIIQLQNELQQAPQARATA